MDGGAREGGKRQAAGGGVSTGEELCFGSAMPKICFHLAARKHGGGNMNGWSSAHDKRGGDHSQLCAKQKRG